MLGRFNADTAALRHRESLNAALAARNLEDWITERARPRVAERVLDIGCGTGKQIFHLVQRIGRLDILGIDISAEAVATVARHAREQGIQGVDTARIGIDECADRLARRSFDLILSTYAIYYSSDLAATVRRLPELLQPHGRAFLSGPGAGTNRELISIVRSVAGDRAAIPDVTDFMSQDQIEAVRPVWAAIELHRLDNEVRFPNVDAVLDWWRHHNSHRNELERGVTAELDRIIAREGSFRLTKNVLGIELNRS